jgi:hypothetical protein
MPASQNKSTLSFPSAKYEERASTKTDPCHFSMTDFMRWQQDFECGWYNEIPPTILKIMVEEKLVESGMTFESEEKKDEIINKQCETLVKIGTKNSNDNFVAMTKHLYGGKVDLSDVFEH